MSIKKVHDEQPNDFKFSAEKVTLPSTFQFRILK